MMLRTVTIALLLLILIIPLQVAAGAMTKNIEAVRPRIGQCGTNVEVSIQGVSLGNPREIIFFSPGIRAVNLQPATPLPRRSFAHGGTIVEEVRCTFEIASDCPLGEHAFRLLTATELTCIGTFHVSPFPVIDEEEKNNAHSNDTLETAQPVELTVTVRGQLASGAQQDRDVYRIEGKAGQRLSVEVESARIADQHYGDSEFDLALRVLDREGRVLAINDDNSLHLQDPLKSVKLPQDGPVFVEVRHSIFTPRDTLYCVHIGQFPLPLAAFPPGGQAGTRQSISFRGDAMGTFEQSIDLPDSTGDFFYFGGNDASTRMPSAMRLRSSPYPNVLEDNSADENGVSKLPAALNGTIDSATDVDIWRFTARKGEKLLVRVFAASLGSPIDAAIRIRRLGDDGRPGEVELELDDSPLQDHDIFGTNFRSGGGLPEVIDPSIMWEPKQDGEYLLEIRDTSGAGGTTGVYRIEIEPPRTVVQTLLASATFDWTESTRVTGLSIPRGNRWTLDFSLPRGQWKTLDGEFDFVVNGLPRGVRIVSPPVKPDAGRWPIQFIAEPDAELAGALITLEARPIDSSQSVEVRHQQNVPFINHSGGNAWRVVQTRHYILGVTDPAPFSVDIEEPPVALVRGGELVIPVKIIRHGKFDGAVEIRCGNVPRSISTPPPLIVPPDANEGLLQLGAELNTPLESLPLYVIGSTVRDDIDPFLGAGHVRVSSQIVTLNVSAPYVELASQPGSIRRGEKKPFVWTIRHHTPFEGTARVSLLGLPKGIRVFEPFPTLTKESETVTFELIASEEALLGQALGLICEVAVPIGEQQIVQRTGKGSLRIDPAKEKK